MGLELDALIRDVHHEHDLVADAIWIGVLAWVIVVLVRAAYVVPLLLALHRRALRRASMRGHLEDWQLKLDGGHLPTRVPRGREPRTPRDQQRYDENVARRGELLRTRVRRSLADIDYLAGAPLGWREGT